MPILRARFAKEIVAEFLPPSRPSKKVIIFCGGLPSVPSKRSVLEFWSKKGYWVFFPRYRGTWESGGKLFKRSSEEDIRDVIEELTTQKKVISLWDNVAYTLEPKEIYIFGSSFGGTAALLLSRDPRVKKVVALSPVVDWTDDTTAEPIDWLVDATRDAFGEAYRYDKKDWQKLKTGTFYNPMAHVKEYDPKKIFLIHAADDDLISLASIKKFAKETACKLWLMKRGGHFSLGNTTKLVWYKKITTFLKT